eukprot:jgi/Pico_ML_1/54781/g646.t1
MERLGVDYLDIVQCHDIEFGSIKQIAAIEALNGDMMQAEMDLEKELIDILAPVKNMTWPSGLQENN